MMGVLKKCQKVLDQGKVVRSIDFTPKNPVVQAAHADHRQADDVRGQRSGRE